jgi:ABC-type multidrug transport system fused ATPase/permease subunit
MVYGAWQVGEFVWAMLWFTIFFIWIWLLITVFADIFRSKDMGGFAKALWVLFVIFLPYLGVFVYLIARGHKMAEHAQAAAKAQDEANRAYIQSVTGSAASPADQIAKASELKEKGLISDEEFQALKAKALAGG